MAVNLSPFGGVGVQFFDNSGNPLTGGKIFTYTAGTTTPQTTYTTSAGTTPHTNPIILDAGGRVPSGGEIWLTDGLQYKFLLKDANDVQIASYDNITGINSNFVAFTNSQEIQTATAGQTVFTLTTMQYQPGTNSLSVFVDGVNQYGPGAQYAYVETDSTTVTFTNGLHVGAEVKFTTSQLNSGGATDAALVSYDPPFTGSVATNVEAKLAQTVSVMDFGAVGDGVTDDTVAIQAALDYIKNSGKSAQLDFCGLTYKVTNTLTIDVSTVLVNGNGATIDFSSMSTGHAITIKPSNNGSHSQPAINTAHPFSNIYINGPDASSNVDGFYFDGTGIIANLNAGIVFKNVGVNLFENQFVTSDGTVFIGWKDCVFTTQGGNAGCVLKIAGSSNAGENYQFDHCFSVGVLNFIWDFIGNPNCDIFCNDCSVDGTVRLLTGGATRGSAGADCRVEFRGGHIEDWSGADYLVNSANGGVRFSGTSFVPPNSPATTFGKSTYGGVNQGIVLRDTVWYVSGSGWSSSLPSQYFCEGTGGFQSSGFSGVGNSYVAMLSQSNNLIPNFTLPASTDLTDRWTLNGGHVTYDTTTYPAGTTPSAVASIKMERIGSNQTALISAPCKPGDVVSGSVYCTTTGFTGGEVAYGTIYFSDAKGNLISGFQLFTLTADDSYNNHIIASQLFAPAGTVNVNLLLGLNNGGTAWFALPMLVVQ